MANAPLPLHPSGWTVADGPGPAALSASLRRDEGAALVLGVLFTAALFVALARVEAWAPEPALVAGDDLRRVPGPVPLPPPPPPVSAPRPEADLADALPLGGLELGPSDSPVTVAVVPPDFEALLPTAAPVAARTQPPPPAAELAARLNLTADVGRVYQENEIDQRVRAIVRTVPDVPAEVSADAASLRVLLLLLIDPQGRVLNARLVESSGRRGFDEVVARCVEAEWRFTPPTRRGRKVKVLAQQAIRINFRTGGSPFSLDR